MKNEEKLNSTLHLVIEILIRLGFLLLLVAWCFRLLYPFVGIIIWGIILALAASPLFKSLNKKLGGRSKLTAVLFIIIGLILLLIPTGLFIDSLFQGVKEIKLALSGEQFKIPLPPEKVASWPLIGNKVYNFWILASENIEAVVMQYKDQIKDLAKILFSGVVSIGNSTIQFIGATIIAGILLATKGTDLFAKKFFTKLVGNKSEEYLDVFEKTVQNVVKGIIGVALIQSVLTGIGFLFAGVPYAGLWALLVLILAILQLPPALVVLPIIIYIFSTLSVIPATLWTIYLIIAGLSDNFLKPILLGKGAPVPMIVIFVGVIGGFLLSGFIGLFTGAIVISLGYKLFIAWINDPGDHVGIKTER